MKLSEAQDIVILYATLFKVGSNDQMFARNEDELYHSKEEIKEAFKLYMAYVGLFKTHTNDEIDGLFFCLSRLNLFTNNAEQEYINDIWKRSHKQKNVIFKPKIMQKEVENLAQFVAKSFSNDFSDEVIDAYNKSQKHTVNWVVNEKKSLALYDFYRIWCEEILNIEYSDELAEEIYHFGEKESNKQEV